LGNTQFICPKCPCGGGSEKKNGRAHSAAAKFCDPRPTVFGWQHDIDNEKIELCRTRKLQTGLAVLGKIDSEARFTQTFGQKSRRFLSSSITRIRIAPIDLARERGEAEYAEIGQRPECCDRYSSYLCIRASQRTKQSGDPPQIAVSPVNACTPVVKDL
jgi:hypothetical protein